MPKGGIRTSAIVAAILRENPVKTLIRTVSMGRKKERKGGRTQNGGWQEMKKKNKGEKKPEKGKEKEKNKEAPLPCGC